MAHSILTKDLAMKRMAAKFIPKFLTAEQKQLCVEVSQDMMDSTNSDPNSLQLMDVPQTQEAIERKAISDKRGRYDCNDSQAQHHSKRGLLRLF